MLGVLLLASGCDLLDAFKPASSSNKLPSQAAQDPKSLLASKEAVPGSGISAKEKFAFHRWLVTEMQEQIFSRPVKNSADSEGWANVLSQKGSIEGVYHGFVLSSEYFALEKGKAANIKALRFYGTEMAMMDFPASPENDPKVQAAASRYVKDKMQETVYTLKRELGERILHEAEKRKTDNEKLAAWYAGIAIRWIKQDVSFGLPQRNTNDEVFHFNWAKNNSFGMLEWELLNREHRIFNQLGGIAVTSPASAPSAPAANPAHK